MPKGIALNVIDSYFPDTTLWREKNQIVAEITEHVYTKYWQHKWHGRVYAEAMLRAIKRFTAAEFIMQFGAFQQKVLPWMKAGKTP